MATYEGTTFEEMNLPNILEVGDVIRLNYSGAMQLFNFSKFTNFNKIKLKFELWGASSLKGGQGGYATGEKTFNRSDVLYFYCGGQGSRTLGGFNGGGNPPKETTKGYGGGGATDVRLNIDDLYNRFIVAGGGTMGALSVSGFGGGLEGEGYEESGGTQTRGGINPYGTNGLFGRGGDCVDGEGAFGCAGGGGWYGGAGAKQTSSSNVIEAMAGGGSAYIGGVENGETQSGGSSKGNAGDGYIIITVLEIIKIKGRNFEGIAKRDNVPNYGD